MTDQLQKEQIMRDLAGALQEVTKELYGRPMGFFLCVAPFENGDGQDGVADYISNADRESALRWIRETLERLELRQDIAAPGHERIQ